MPFLTKMAESGTVEKLKTADKKLTTGKALKNEMEIMLGPSANWENFLVPTPMCICILGQLMLTSTIADFTLDKNPPKDGFKLLKYPKSFRACLMQVSHHFKVLSFIIS